MSFTPRRHIPLILGVLGTVFLSVGVYLLTTDAPSRDAVRGTALPLVTARSLSELEPGSTVLLEVKPVGQAFLSALRLAHGVSSLAPGARPVPTASPQQGLCASYAPYFQVFTWFQVLFAWRSAA